MRYERRKYTSELFEIMVALDGKEIVAAYLFIKDSYLLAPGPNTWLCGELEERGEFPWPTQRQ